jgi:phosphatidylglycerophosphatase A
VAVAVATLGGIGRAPVAPGTVASVVTAAALWLLQLPPLALVVLLIAVVGVGTWAAEEAERALGGQDPGALGVDEVAGMMLAVLAVPLTTAVLVVAFLLFRVFDVVKPFPANVAQRLRGGVGVMADDLVAGLYALALVGLARALGWL